MAPGNFDIRTDTAAVEAAMKRAATSQSGARAAGVGDLASVRAADLARLHATFKDVEVVDNPELGTPEIVGVKPGGGFLTAASADRVGAMRGFLSSYADVYGLSQDQVASLELVADYANPAGNMAWVEFEQQINGLPVFRGLIRGGFTASGELARTTGPLAAGLDAAALSTSPTLTAAQAVSQAAANVGWTRRRRRARAEGGHRRPVTFARGDDGDEPKAWLLYFPLAPGVARLAWATEIWGDPDAFLILLGRRGRHGAVPQEPDELSDAVGHLPCLQRRQPGADVAEHRPARHAARRRPFIARTLSHAHRQRSAEHVQQPGLDDRRHQRHGRQQRRGRPRPRRSGRRRCAGHRQPQPGVRLRSTTRARHPTPGD